MRGFRAIIAISPLILHSACSDTKEEVVSVETEVVKSAESIAAESDLKVTAKLESSKTIFPDERIEISPLLVNTSPTKSYRMIKPGDGSSDGRREPYIFYTVQYGENDGQWIEAPRRTVYGCGVYSEDWARDFHDLPPGSSIVTGETPQVNFFVAWGWDPGRMGQITQLKGLRT